LLVHIFLFFWDWMTVHTPKYLILLTQPWPFPILGHRRIASGHMATLSGMLMRRLCTLMAQGLMESDMLWIAQLL
jgi:hypothetical protein